jgi:polyribonucleotide nucleotidyltransferase
LPANLAQDLRAPYPERNDLVQTLREQMYEHFEKEIGDEFERAKRRIRRSLYNGLHKDVRDGIVKENVRPDGRKLTEIRQLSQRSWIFAKSSWLQLIYPRHDPGLNIVTLAPLSYAQMVDTMETEGERRYLHHYNAPGYTVGEVRRLGSPGRREIGHGYLQSAL